MDRLLPAEVPEYALAQGVQQSSLVGPQEHGELIVTAVWDLETFPVPSFAETAGCWMASG